MKRNRARTGLVGVLGATLMALAVGTPAQASGPTADGQHARTTVLTAPSAPAGVTPALRSGELSAAAVSPSVSPWAPSIHVEPGGSWTCGSGNLCTAVWDLTTDNWEIFRLGTCARYYLSNWEDWGPYWNEQTGGRSTRSVFYDEDGDELVAFYAGDSSKHRTDWSPVWSIRNC